ncbi:mitochondrial carrier domain-containing protein [Gorgonomyces haynaldii]|nr:mitochondrial carrier domain-containing protein [Gorgonomyces haynaldii]
MIDNLVAGAVAGTTVDFLLFPLDTLKTRLQSKQGFQSAGGFTNIYRGLSSCIAGSAPSASMFFVTYEYFKTSDDPLNHMWAASLGEMMACLVRVPTEIVKQRMQVGMHSSVKSTLSNILKQDGFFGLYRGYLMTVFREIPFSSIQFPLYERLKLNLKIHLNREIRSYEAGCCGAIAGATAAALTTPLDVIKTRLMLSSKVPCLMIV